MGARAVGGTVVRAAIGVAVGVALMLLIDGRRGASGRGEAAASRTNEVTGRARAPDEPPHIEPTSAPRPLAGDVVAAAVVREVDAPRSDASDDELARIREQVAALQAEVKRLRALLADGTARHHALHKLIAANELQHGRLYEELLGLIVDEPEGVTEDPRRAFELIVRLVDETGLAGASVVDGERTVEPEPAAPDLRLTLRHESGVQHVDPGDGAAPVDGSYDEMQFHAYLALPKAPEGWLGDPLAAEVTLNVRVADRYESWLRLVMDVKSTRIAPEVSWSLQWTRDEAYLDRSPYRGADESKVATPAELATERAWADRVFQQLTTRAR